MRGSWIRRVIGRSLLRERPHLRTRWIIGECPRCGRELEGSSDCWFDADRVITEHLQTCERDRPVQVARRHPSAAPASASPGTPRS